MSDPGTDTGPPLIDYLPSGWTHEKVKTASLEDFESLSEEELKKFGEAQQRHTKALSEYNERRHGLKLDDVPSVTGESESIGEGSTDVGVDGGGSAKRTADELDDALSGGEGGASVETATKKRNVREPMQRHVEVLQRNGYEKWGFVIIRADDYSNDSGGRWDAFKTKWKELMDELLNDPSSGITQEMKDGYRSHFLEDASKYANFLDVEGGSQNIKKEAERLREEDILVDGLDIGMALVVNNEVISSVLGDVDEENEEDEFDKPWVWAVDTDYDPNEDDDDEEEEYPGRFKVAVGALLEELWAMLASDALDPTEIWPLADPVFEGI